MVSLKATTNSEYLVHYSFEQTWLKEENWDLKGLQRFSSLTIWLLRYHSHPYPNTLEFLVFNFFHTQKYHIPQFDFTLDENYTAYTLLTWSVGLERVVKSRFTQRSSKQPRVFFSTSVYTWIDSSGFANKNSPPVKSPFRYNSALRTTTNSS